MFKSALCCLIAISIHGAAKAQTSSPAAVSEETVAVFSSKGFSGPDSVLLARVQQLSMVNLDRLTNDGVLDPAERNHLGRLLTLNEKVAEYDGYAAQYKARVTSLMGDLQSGAVTEAVAQQRLAKLAEDSAEVIAKREDFKDKLKMTVKQLNGELLIER